MTAPMRAAIYVRKSSTVGLDAEFNSLDNQRESCRAFIKARSWAEVPTLYSDGGYSGGTVDRPAFQRLLADAAAGKLDVIMVHRLDRFSRSVADFARLLDELKRLGVGVVSVTEGFDTSTAAGTLMINIIISMAQWEREAASERLRVKFAAARRKGLFTGGNPPLGYRIEDKRLVIDDAEAEPIRFAFAEAARGIGMTAIARALNDRGWRTRMGKTWLRQRLRGVLQNRIYVGQIRAGDEWVDAQHEALIDLDTFGKAQGQMRTRVTKAPRKGYRYMLSGLVRCMACGGRFGGNRYKSKGGDTITYVCARPKGGGGCASRPIPGDALEDFVIDHLRGRIDDGLAGEVLTAIEQRIEADRKVLTRQRAALEQQRSRLAQDARDLAQAIEGADNAATRAFLQTQLDDAAHRDNVSQLELAELDHKLAEVDAQRVDGQWLAEVLSDWDRLWALLTPANRQQLLATVVQEIRIDEPAGLIEVDLIDFSQPQEAVA